MTVREQGGPATIYGPSQGTPPRKEAQEIPGDLLLVATCKLLFMTCACLPRFRISSFDSLASDAR